MDCVSNEGENSVGVGWSDRKEREPCSFQPTADGYRGLREVSTPGKKSGPVPSKGKTLGGPVFPKKKTGHEKKGCPYRLKAKESGGPKQLANHTQRGLREKRGKTGKKKIRPPSGGRAQAVGRETNRHITVTFKTQRERNPRELTGTEEDLEWGVDGEAWGGVGERYGMLRMPGSKRKKMRGFSPKHSINHRPPQKEIFQK